MNMPDPVCITIAGHPIHWYGIMAALGFIAALIHYTRLERRDGWPAGFGADLAFWLMVSGLLGSRLAYVIANWSEYSSHPIEIIRFDRGGLIYYGGFILAFISMIVLARVRRIPFWAVGDLAASGLPLAHAIARMGCLLNGCCFGAPACGGWGVVYPEHSAAWRLHGLAPLYPVQFFETLANLAVYVGLLWFYPRKRFHGAAAAFYLTTYPVFRFFIEFLRGDERMRFGLDVAQLISIGLFVMGCALWIILPRLHRTPAASPS
jgi:phosphatidylglycerol:prolipoprotein diacylglycerol transferase